METFSLANLEDVGNARLTGEALAMKVRKMSVAQRAALAARLVHCEVSVAGFIPTQAAALTKVGIGNVRLAAGASEADIAALKRGRMSLSQLRAKHRKPPTAIDIENLVLRAGPTAIMHVLDRMTAPLSAAAE